MSLKGMMTGRKAYKAHGNGNYAEALKLYDEAWTEGMDNPRWILGYTVLLLRDGQYAKAREILVKLQKNPALTPDMKNQLFINYAAAVFRMGETDKGIRLLERQHAQGPAGLIYQTLGYLYIEKYVPENTPDFDAIEAAAKQEAEAAKAVASEAGDTESTEAAPAEAEPVAPQSSAREEWQKAKDKAEAFIRESIDYDDEDSVCLDNMGQWVYRVLGDHDGAKEWFEKALKIKPSQIDTLWFLSRYDLDKGDSKAALQKIEAILENGRFSPLNYVDRKMAEDELARLKA
ncbi:MAG: tetratricopeptide repeat protein [Clostridia bacterium]|nr:tetratricopeptide repeat protein [Clostridia bacterium]